MVCTGLTDDEIETPEDYRALLDASMRARSLFMLCANPDLVVERGDTLVYCAGAIADLYGTLGGEVLYAGKPHRPIYEQALDEVAQRRAARRPPLDRVLAIGDSVRTDLKGAIGVRDRLPVRHRRHPRRGAGRPRDNPDAAALRQDVRGRRASLRRR